MKWKAIKDLSKIFKTEREILVKFERNNNFKFCTFFSHDMKKELNGHPRLNQILEDAKYYREVNEIEAKKLNK